MKRFKYVIAAALGVAIALATVSVCRAAGPDYSLGVGAQQSWFDKAAFNSDTELGGVGAVSLTPHISGVGSAWYGLGQSYGRGAAGVRLTATDVNDPNFSVGLGLERQWVSKCEAGQDEWVADASVGWKALPWCILAGQGAYGLDSRGLRTSVGFRIPLKLVRSAQ